MITIDRSRIPNMDVRDKAAAVQVEIDKLHNAYLEAPEGSDEEANLQAQRDAKAEERDAIEGFPGWMEDDDGNPVRCVWSGAPIFDGEPAMHDNETCEVVLKILFGDLHDSGEFVDTVPQAAAA